VCVFLFQLPAPNIFLHLCAQTGSPLTGVCLSCFLHTLASGAAVVSASCAIQALAPYQSCVCSPTSGPRLSCTLQLYGHSCQCLSPLNSDCSYSPVTLDNQPFTLHSKFLPGLIFLLFLSPLTLVDCHSFSSATPLVAYTCSRLSQHAYQPTRHHHTAYTDFAITLELLEASLICYFEAHCTAALTWCHSELPSFVSHIDCFFSCTTVLQRHQRSGM